VLIFGLGFSDKLLLASLIKSSCNLTNPSVLKGAELMKSNYTFKHLDYSESLVNYTNEKLDEIGQYLLKDGRSSVYYSKSQHEFVVEVSVNTRQKFFKATAAATDIYIAVDMIADKLERQFLKVKEIYMDHKKPELSCEGKLHTVNSQFEFQPKTRKVG
jgi:putative sigma-54 modulation protein